MSTLLAERTPPTTSDQPRIGRGTRLWLYALAALLALSAARVVTGADDLTSAGTLQAAIIAAIPIALAGLGGLWSERAGVVNIGLEGMMILGTLGAGYYTYYQGVWVGLLGAIMFGAIGGVLHAVATVVFAVDHIVSGVAINIIAAGVAAFMAEVFFADLEGGGPTQSPSLDRPPTLTVPVVADASADLAGTGWFAVSDLGALVNALTEELSVFTVLALVVIFGTGWLLWHTAFGLRLRSCGESPSSAETLGVNVYRYKFVAVTMSGVLAGFGGCYLAVVASSGYANGQTGGRGYIGLAAMIFGNWRPGGLLTGSLLFGFTEGARLRSGGESVHALLLLVALGLLVLAVWQVYRAHVVSAALSGLIGAGAMWWYLATDTVPGDFTEMTPYVTTLLVLALASQRLRMPAADGLPYRRGGGVSPRVVNVDWADLRSHAVGAMHRAYAPYSGFPVGAAALVDDGRVVAGCNVENASYGVGLCAECGLVSALHAGGGGRLVAVAVVDRAGSPLMPCGRCRQLLWEQGGPDCLLQTPSGVQPMSDVLPDAFGAHDLADR